MRVVVTGASGNVGTAVLRALARDPGGPHQVLGVSRHRPPPSGPYDVTGWVETDLGTEPATAALTEACTGADAVVHLAWLIQPSWDRERLRRTNQDGSRRVVEACQRAGVPRLVYASSVGTYAPAEPGQWVDESWSTAGVSTSSYSVDKAAVESMLDDVDAGRLGPRLAVARLRPGLILQPDAASEIMRYFVGPLVPRRLVHPALLRVLPWPRDLAVQFVHADDVADAVLRILHRGATGPFNLAADPVVDRDRIRALVGGRCRRCRHGPAGALVRTAAGGRPDLAGAPAAHRSGLARPRSRHSPAEDGPGPDRAGVAADPPRRPAAAGLPGRRSEPPRHAESRPARQLGSAHVRGDARGVPAR